jgi:hypothetical protein
MTSRGQWTDRPPDLWPEIERRLMQQRSSRRGAFARIAAIAIALGVFAASGLILLRAFSPGDATNRPAGSPLDGIPVGWTQLPDPPQVRDGAAFVWTGTELLAWGGCDPAVHDNCEPTRDGFAFDPVTERWSAIAPGPAALAYAHAVWTGDEAVFLSLSSGDAVGGVSYRPSTGTWREIADAPLAPRYGAVTVWTGSHIFVWGGGEASDPATDGALFDPLADTWSSIAPPPIALNHASGVWTGSEVIVFGALLDNGNHATTATSVGAAYDPAMDVWRELPPSDLSPQAISAVWAGDRMVAWDYETFSQTYDPSENAWTRRQRMPLDFSECYPDSMVVDGRVFAFFCGRAALYDPGTSSWREIHGGLVDAEIWSDAYERYLKLWRFASLVPAHEVGFLAAWGITLGEKGVACYGCTGSPTSLWAYRPPAPVPSEHAGEAGGNVVYQAPYLAGGEGWYVRRGDPAPEGDATTAWAATVPFEESDVRLGAAIPPDTILALPPDGVVITALATPWEQDPSFGPYPNGLAPFDLSTAEVREPVAEEPAGDYAVYEMDRPGVLVRVYFGTSTPSQATLALAQAQLDTLVPPPVCPAPATGGYGARLSQPQGHAGDVVTISGPMPFVRKDGSFDTTGETVMIAWWNARPEDWPYLASFATSEPSPAVSGSPLERLGEGGKGACSFAITFAVPDVPPGNYPIVVLQEGGGGATMEAALTFRVLA